MTEKEKENKNGVEMRPKNILIYGDSMLAEIRALSGSLVHNECVPGMDLRDAMQSQDHMVGLSFVLQEDEYDLAIICLGTNDMGKGRPAEETISDLVRLLESVISPNPTDSKVCARLAVMGFPFASDEDQVRLEESLPDQVYFIPFMDLTRELLLPDGIHLNIKGKRAMRKYLEKEISTLPPVGSHQISESFVEETRTTE
jgi:hypothetical protein